MLNEKLASELEQMRTYVAEVFPPMWRTLYLACLREGFTEDQSMDLVKSFMLLSSRER